MSNEKNPKEHTDLKKTMDTGRVTAIINEVLDKREPALESRIMEAVEAKVQSGVTAGLDSLRKEIRDLGAMLSNKIDIREAADGSRMNNIEKRQNTNDEKVDRMETEGQKTREQILKQAHDIEKTRDDIGDIAVTLNGDPNKTNDNGIRGSMDNLVKIVNQLNQRMISAETWQNNADRYIEIFWRTVKGSAKRAWEFRRLIALAGVGGGTAGAFLLKALEVLTGG